MRKCNFITVNTDASFLKEPRGHGYAFYIICDYFKITKGGMFKAVIPNAPHEAEIMCIGNALSTLLAQSDLLKCKLLVINTDSKVSIQHISNPRPHQTIAIQVNAILTKLMIKLGCTYEFRHVKAHTGISDKRSYINEWCDKEASKWLKKSLEGKPHINRPHIKKK